ncbi:Platinum sensitivity protein, partial [Haplosporangium sp. Z 27]
DKSGGALVVHSEQDENEVLLRSIIRTGNDIYQRQQATLIVWSEEDDTDLALSFQEAEGCTEIWGDINEVQQHYDVQDLFSDPLDHNDNITSEYITLPDPDPNLSNLKEIHLLIKEVQGHAHEREKLSSFIIVDVNDPESSEKKVADYRGFLTNTPKFKQIIPIKDPEVEQKIHQVFRVQFLRDTVLSRYMDENLSSMFGSLIFFHNIDIVNAIHQDRPFLKSLFEIMENNTEPLERKRDVVRFVQQFCSIARSTQITTRVGLFRTLVQNGLFSVFYMALSDNERSIKMAGAEIMLSALEHDASLIRSHIVKQSEEMKEKRLFDVLINQFLVEQDAGVMIQLSELIRVLIDTNPSLNEGMISTSIHILPILDSDADKFLDLFYSEYAAKFVSALLNLSEAALKFFRSCIGLHDDFYCNILIENNVITHILDVLFENSHKNNLVNSICLEFFMHIGTDMISPLLAHVATVHKKRIMDITYTEIFRKLIKSYEQQQQWRQQQLQQLAAVENKCDIEGSSNKPETSRADGGPSGKEGSSSEGSGSHTNPYNSKDSDDGRENVDLSIPKFDTKTPTESTNLPIILQRPPRRKLNEIEDSNNGELSTESSNSGDDVNSPPEKRKRLNQALSSQGSPSSDCNSNTSSSEDNGSPIASSDNVSAIAPSQDSTNENNSSPDERKNGKSPSLSPTDSGSQSAPLSPLPRVANRTGIVFVKAGADLKDLQQQNAIMDANKAQAAIKLKSELATGSGDQLESEASAILLAKRRRENDDENDSGDSDDGRQPGASKRKSDNKEANSTISSLFITPQTVISPISESESPTTSNDNAEHPATDAGEKLIVMNKDALTSLRVYAE